MRATSLLFIPVVAAFFTLPLAGQQPCDMIFHHGIIHTLDSTGTTAAAMAVRKGRIVGIGREEDVRSMYRSSRQIDLKGQHVFPGFIDAHAHLYGIGEKASLLPLQTAESRKGIVALVAAATRSVAPGAWIRGRGWDQNRWEEKAFPGKAELDAVSPRHPVMLIRVDGHAAWVNSRALDIAGISAATPDPPGGRILKDASGIPSGILLDEAIELVRTKIPQPNPTQRQAVYRSALAACAARGITGMHDMGIHHEQIDAIRSLIRKKQFPFRMTAYIDGRGDDWEALLKTGRTITGDDQLTLAGLKLYADGALGSRGALLFEEYADDPGNKGIPILPRDSIRYETERALQRGLQVCVHAIGDAANRLTLNAFEEALRTAPTPHPPLRVEHAQVLSPQDIPRFGALGVIASMQPIHCTSDMYWAEARLGGTRVHGAYAWNSLISHGALIAGGSDAPVEDPNPLWGMFAACTRKDHSGRPATIADIEQFFQLDKAALPNPSRFSNGWYTAETVGRANAMRMFTRWAADAAGQSAVFGSLEKGKYADFVILGEDITTVQDNRLWNTQVVATYVGGQQVYPQVK
jgi:predicted amidohydrolase YtcJ